MEIKAKKHQGYLCVLCPENLIQPVARVVRGRLSKTWKCVVAAWSSVNCLALKQGAEKYGWTITAEPDFYRASAPLESSVDNSALLQDTENRILVEGRRLWAHQREAFAKLSGLTGCIFDMGMGPQPLSAKVVTPSGYKTMGELSCGDSVIGADGKPTIVLEVHDFAPMQVYEVCFSDKSKTRCTEGHLWQVATPKQKHRNTTPRIKSLAKIISEGLKTSSGWWRHFIPMTGPVEFEAQGRCTLDPYFVGLLLGDGGITRDVTITTPDEEILSFITSILPDGMSVKHRSRYTYGISLNDCSFNMCGRNQITNELRRLGLFGLKTEDKFIPREYLLSSVENRIAIMQGLLDTDGFGQINAAGIEYSTSSSRLADDFSFLVRSLGGTATMAIKKTKCLDSYRFYVKVPKGVDPFRLTRRKVKYDKYLANPTRSIRSIEPVGVEPVRCIKVENSDGLYLTDDFIVTHNTGKGLTAITTILSGKHDLVMVVCPKSVVPVWPAEFKKHCRFDVTTYTGPKQKSASVAKWAECLQKEMDLAYALKKPLVFVVNYEKIWQSALADLLLKTKFDVIVYDECVPAGTKISTPTGDVNIEDIKIGDVVYGYNEEGGVIIETHVGYCFKRETAEPIYQIIETEMTGNHPVWTENRGYIRADEIRPLDTVGFIGLKDLHGNDKNNMRVVWGGEGNPGEQEVETAPVLLKKLFGKMEVHTTRTKADGQDFRRNKGSNEGEVEKADVVSGVPREVNGVCELGQESVQRPREASSDSRKSRIDIERKGLRAPFRRKRKGLDGSATPSGGCSWVGNRGSRFLRKRLKKTWSPNALFDRYCKQSAYGCNRGGWSVTYRDGCSGEGCKKRKVSVVARMEDDQVLKQRNLERCGSMRKSCVGPRQERVVYNIETGAGNYFANKLLVHNCHRLKGQNGTASKFAAKLQRNADRIIGCTGTLLPHSPMDAFGICRAIDPALFGAHFIAFKSRYAIMGGFEGKQVVGYQNEQELHDKLAMISYRIRTEDAVDLPPAQHIVRTFELGPKTRKVYDKMHNEMCVEIEGHDLTAANAMVKVLRLQQITSGIMPDSEGELVRLGTEKRDLFADMLEDIPTDEPVVVFCRFTADILAVREAAAAQNRAVYELSGKENELATWQAEKRGVLAVQIRAGKEGVDFTIASIAFYYSIGHSLGDYDQSLRRNHRPGQTRPVVYYHLVAKDTVDEEVYASLDKKRDVVEYILETLKRR